MKMIKAVLLLVLSVSIVGLAQEKKAEPAKSAEPEYKQSKVQSSPEWEKIKSLAGSWEATVENMKMVTTYEVVSAGSAVMMKTPGMKPGEEMITMFHPDGKNILVTHYCSSKNQPRMKMAAANKPNEIQFAFLDVTNLGSPDEGHMHDLTLILDGPDHHVQQWTFAMNGKMMTDKFDLKRVKN